MAHDTRHTLMYDYPGNTVTARCCCGGWAWNPDRSGDMLPLEAFVASQAEHRCHVAGDVPHVVPARMVREGRAGCPV